MTATSSSPAAFELPAITPERLGFIALLVAAGLVGFGVILLVAANWDEIGKPGRFGLVGAVIAAGGLAALLRPALSAPALLVAFAATGGMLALIGQTYQTGADAWQLFALWAALTLPWCIGARSDVLWVPWVVVAMTALALWQVTYGLHLLYWPEPAAGRTAPRLHLPTLAAWACAFALCGLMSRRASLERLLGARRWAFRLAVVLALALVAGDTLTAILAGSWALSVMYLLGLAALAAATVLLALQRPRDALLLAAGALSLDAALIGGIVRWIEPQISRSAFAYTLIGICAALIVAASVVVLMRLLGRSLTLARADAGPAEPAASSEMSQRPWPVIVLSGIGALMAMVPFMVAFFVLFGNALDRGPLVYLLALMALAFAIAGLFNWRGLFLEQLAVVLLALGIGLLIYALTRDLPAGAAALAVGVVLLGIAVGLGRGWIGALLGAAAAPCLAVAMIDPFPNSILPRGPVAYAIVWSLIALAWAAAVHGTSRDRPLPLPAWLRTGALDATIAGWGAAALAGLAIGSGRTFLLGGILDLGGSGSYGGVSAATIGLARGLSLALALAGLWLLRNRQGLDTRLGVAIVLCVAGLSFVMPGLGAVVLVLAVALTTGQRTIAIAAVVALLWIAGAFYYNLSLTLTEKGAILIAAGVLVGLASLFSGARVASPGPLLPAAVDGLSPAIARGLAALGLLAVGATAGQAIRSREALIREGRPVFVELMPVDPRSLMQGDYMALRFALPDGALRHHPAMGPAPRAIGRIEQTGVVRLARIGDRQASLGPDEIAITLVRKGSRWILVTDAWFFKEGTARKWEAARYGELRVTPDGRALLVGLADKDMKPIK